MRLARQVAADPFSSDWLWCPCPPTLQRPLAMAAPPRAHPQMLPILLLEFLRCRIHPQMALPMTVLERSQYCRRRRLSFQCHDVERQ